MARSIGDALAGLANMCRARLAERDPRERASKLDALAGIAGIADFKGFTETLRGHSHERVAPAAEHVSDGVVEIERVAARFELTPFERDLLLLALAPELDVHFSQLLAVIIHPVHGLRPTVGAAIDLLAGGSWSAVTAFSPDARLVRHGLLEVIGDLPLSSRQIRLPDDVWPRLAGVSRPATTDPQSIRRYADLVLAHATRQRIDRALRQIQLTSTPEPPPGRPTQPSELPVVAIHGAHGRLALARAAAAESGPFVEVDAAAAAGDGWRARVRDAIWHDAAIVVGPGVTTARLADVARSAKTALFAAVEPAQVASLVTALAGTSRAIIDVAIDELDHDGRAELWRVHGAERAGLDVHALASRYRFEPGRVAAVMALATGGAADGASVIAACRTIGGAGGSKLAYRLQPSFIKPDLIIANTTRNELDLFTTAAREGHKLFRRGARGERVHGSHGFCALFSGPPGTGKTMAAQIVARDIDIDILRIDLSQVLDKYIGETEKHLDQVFHDAEASGSLLFFDEADALFSKRTDPKSSNDRYANVETAYLLQRLEQYPGITILASNLLGHFDHAYLRRIQFIVQFPLPTRDERRAIWERHLPTEIAGDIDLGFLSAFELSGGVIRNAVIAAVLFSADEPRLAMRHLVLGTVRELRKAGRMIDAHHFGSWRHAVHQYLAGDPDAKLPDHPLDQRLPLA
jgi:hypothetical protein